MAPEQKRRSRRWACQRFHSHTYVCLLFASILITATRASVFVPPLNVSAPDPYVKVEGFKTEPNYFPQSFSHIFKTQDNSLLSDGYIFLAMMREEIGYWGPQIYDHDGNIIWFGQPFVKENRIADFHVCDYLGDSGKHLCWHEREANPDPESDKPLLKKVIVDDSYSLLRNYTTRGNSHEFRMVDDGTRFVTMDYKTKRWDLRPYCGTKKGYIHDACIVEYDVYSGQETWDWCLTDHVPIYESSVFFASHGFCRQKNATTPKAGLGTFNKPWDIGHLNALDKNADGDYIASFRHLDQIMKIAGPNSTTHSEPGTIIWRLGGKGNQFYKDFNFSRQHMVRYVKEDYRQNKTTIALFNNAWEGYLDPIARASSGQLIELDTNNMRAKLLQEFIHPKDLLSGSRGSMQLLPNNNAFVGWGILPEISEFSANGTLLFHAQFASYDTGQFSYRAFKSPWIGKPSWPPKLLAYSLECNERSPIYAYVSWNGQTEVRRWRFYTSNTEWGPWIPAATYEKSGFETQAKLDASTALYVSVEGLDSNNRVIGSATSRTFVPRGSLKRSCNKSSCADHFEYAAKAGQTCQPSYTPSIIPFMVLMVLLECAASFTGRSIRKYAESQCGWQKSPFFYYPIRPRSEMTQVDGTPQTAKQQRHTKKQWSRSEPFLNQGFRL